MQSYCSAPSLPLISSVFMGPWRIGTRISLSASQKSVPTCGRGEDKCEAMVALAEASISTNSLLTQEEASETGGQDTKN